jgi:hypothetical protein
MNHRDFIISRFCLTRGARNGCAHPQKREKRTPFGGFLLLENCTKALAHCVYKRAQVRVQSRICAPHARQKQRKARATSLAERSRERAAQALNFTLCSYFLVILARYPVRPAMPKRSSASIDHGKGR